MVGVLLRFLKTILKTKLHIDVYSSFEVQLMRIDIGGPVLYVLVHRPPKFIMDLFNNSLSSSLIPCLIVIDC